MWVAEERGRENVGRREGGREKGREERDE